MNRRGRKSLRIEGQKSRLSFLEIKDVFIKGLGISVVLYAFVHFLSYFYPNPVFDYVLSLCGLSILLFYILEFSFRKAKLPAILAGTGIIIMIISGYPVIDGIKNGLQQMRNIISLFIIIPMISWVLKEENYIESILGWAHRLLDSSKKFYAGMASFVQMIAYFLLVGSIPMMYQFVNMILKEEKGEAWEYFKGTALLRGFALSLMWVVSIPSFAFLVEVMDASLWETILQGFGIAVIGIIITVIFFHFEEKRYSVEISKGLQKEIEEIVSHADDQKTTKRLVIEFGMLFFSLFGTIFFLHAIISVELLIIIPLVILAWILTYYLLKKRPKKLVKNAKRYYTNEVAKNTYTTCVLLGAGLLIFALNQTRFPEMVVNSLYSLQETLPFFNILYFLPLFIIVLGFVGLGPMTVMVLVGGILETMNLSYPPELIVLAVASGSAVSILISPIIIPVILLSNCNGLTPFKNGIVFNWKYAVVLYVVVQVYIQARIYFG